MKILPYTIGFVLLHFLDEEWSKVLNEGPWFLNNQVLIKWERRMEMRNDLLQTIPYGYDGGSGLTHGKCKV